MRSGEESQWWCSPDAHNCRLTMPQQPLEAHVQYWQQAHLHHETDHHTRTPELQLHKQPLMLTNDRAMKHSQGTMIKTTWLPVNSEQKLLQYFQIPISHAILIIPSFKIYLHVIKVSKLSVSSKLQILQKSCHAIKIQYQYSKKLLTNYADLLFISLLSFQINNNENRIKTDAKISKKFYEKKLFQLLKKNPCLI